MYQNQYNPYGSMYQSPYGTQPYYSAYASLQNSQQNFQQPQQQNIQPQQPMQMQTNIEYVNGIEGAKALILPPNAKKLLLDSDNPFFYIKTTDEQGKPSVKCFRYVDVDAEANAPKQEPKVEYATLEQFGQLSDSIKDLQKDIDKLKKSQTKEDKAK